MVHEPKLPITPSALPQQKIHEVLDLPKRPEEFVSYVGFGTWPSVALPKTGLADATYLCQVEWAWSPAHNRIDAYYLHCGIEEWSLWIKHWDDNRGEWQENCCGTVERNDVQENEAAVYLLLDFWSSELQENNLDHFHWINEVGYFSFAEIAAISREVWE